MGNALAGLKDFESAARELDQAIAMDPTRSISFANIGSIQLVRGHHEAARAAFEKAIDLNPKSILARLALANYYWAVNQMRKSERTLREALSLDPENVVTNRALALMFLESGRIAEAEPHVTALSRHANSPASKIELARYYMATRRWQEAEAVIRPLTADPASREAASLQLARMMLMTKRLPEADGLVTSGNEGHSNEQRRQRHQGCGIARAE